MSLATSRHRYLLRLCFPASSDGTPRSSSAKLEPLSLSPLEVLMSRNLVEGDFITEVQDTTFSIDVLGRYVCNTYDEAVNNGGFPFDAIVIGAGMYGAYIAEKIYRKGNGNLRVLVLDGGSFLVSEHVQNLSRIGLNVPGPTTIDPGAPRERVWGLPWRSNVGFP